MSEIKIKSIQFRKEREESWLELQTILEKVELKGLSSLDSYDISRLPILHRYALSSLNVARSISLDQKMLEYLESLTQRSYLAVYGVRKNGGTLLVSFFTTQFPLVIRTFWWAFLLAALIFIGGAVVGFITTLQEPDSFYSIVPTELQAGRGPLATQEELRASLYDKDNQDLLDRLLVFATKLFTHNAQIGIYCFALGFIVGIPVFYLLFLNGEMLGSFSAVFHMQDLSLEWWAWVLPHGITEIGAMILCGGGGLMLAQAILFPGRYSRLKNLSIMGRKAGIVVIGAILLFYLAGLIEGFFRQMVHNVTIRYGVALLSLVLLTLYFTLGGRGEKLDE